MCARNWRLETGMASILDTCFFSVCGVGLYGDLKKITRGVDEDDWCERGMYPPWKRVGLRPLLAA
jgi:hypothetical protein